MNKNSLLKIADGIIIGTAPVSTLYIPPYYSNPVASDAAKAQIASDSFNFALLTRAYLYTGSINYLNKMQNILSNWTTNCKSITNKDDTPLVVCYKFYLFFEGIRLISNKNWTAAYNMAIQLESFTSNVLWDSVISIQNDFNNWASWSIFIQSQRYAMQKSLGIKFTTDVTTIKSLFTKHLDRSTFHIPIISQKNEFWTENIRVNNSLPYTHFSLGPLLLSNELLVGGTNMTDYITTFANNCRYPSIYYSRYGSGSLLGKILSKFVASSSSPELPDPNGWTGEFFFYVDNKYNKNFPQYRDLYSASDTFSVGVGGELLYFVENDFQLGIF